MLGYVPSTAEFSLIQREVPANISKGWYMKCEIEHPTEFTKGYIEAIRSCVHNKYLTWKRNKRFINYALFGGVSLLLISSIIIATSGR